MSENDSIFQEVDDKVARIIRTALEIAQTRRWQLQQRLQGEMAEQMSAERRQRVASATAAPILKPALTDQWWDNASSDDAAQLVGLADRLRETDPLAQEVWTRATTECAQRWGVDITAPPTGATVQASDEEIARVDPRLPDEEVRSAEHLREDTVEQATASATTPEEQTERRDAVIASISASTSMPDSLKARLLAKLEADADVVEDAAESRLTALQSEQVTLESREDHLQARVQSGDVSAEAPLEQNHIDLAEVGEEETLARGDVEAARQVSTRVDPVALRDGYTESEHSVRVREDSTNGRAAEAIKNVSKKTAKAKKNKGRRQGQRTRSRAR